MSYALLFSGQAGQHPAMLSWLESEPAAAPLLRRMGGQLGADWRAMLHDPQRRSANAFAQVVITGTSLAAWAAMRERVSTPPAALAGYSVGELSAYACAGVFSAEQALDLAVRRAALMDQAAAGVATGLLSVAGLPEKTVLARCSDLGIECAIRISAGQAIFAGGDSALAQAASRLVTIGAVCKRLDVRLASHSSWMASAARAFATELAQVQFAPPGMPIALNALGTLSRRPEVLRQALSRQLDNTVLWASCMEAVAERQVRCVLEIGPGSALARMWNDRYPDIPARALDDFQHMDGALNWLAAQRPP